ncbi:MAG: iron-sulfur cluster assembly scaffold protein [Litorimonas sp.]
MGPGVPTFWIMLGQLYNSDILSLSSTLRNERLDQPDGTSRKLSKLCGSWVEVDVAMDGPCVTAAALRVEACALGQASAAILKQSIVGATLDELVDARDSLRAMLKNGGEAPEGRFTDLALLQGVRDYPARHQSTLLAFEAAVEAVSDALRAGATT